MRTYFESFIEWENIRSFGELRILTKLSYTALIMVPVLASLWSSFRITLNQYNVVATKASEILQDVTNKLETEISLALEVVQISNSLEKGHITSFMQSLRAIEHLSDELNLHVRKFVSDFDPQHMDIIDFPLIWTLVFFGSITVVCAHMLYEAKVPQLIRLYTRHSFVNYRIELLGQAIGESENELTRVTDRAEAEYSRMSKTGSHWVRSLICILYLLGLGILVTIIFLQAKLVLQAAGYF